MCKRIVRINDENDSKALHLKDTCIIFLVVPGVEKMIGGILCDFVRKSDL